MEVRPAQDNLRRTVNRMMKRALAASLAATAVFAQYKLEPAGAPPAEVAAAIASDLQPAGHKVLSGDGKVWCELWFRKGPPSGPQTTETDVTWKNVLPGAIVGVIRWPAAGYDRRGQSVKPGVYTLRYSMHPVNGDHLGVAPQRDFLVLTPAALDTDPNPVPVFDALMNMSRKASGTQHPAVLSIYKIDGDFKPGLTQAGEHDWNLHVSVGDVNVAVTIVGKSEA
jgi:hypothetical protein